MEGHTARSHNNTCTRSPAQLYTHSLKAYSSKASGSTSEDSEADSPPVYTKMKTKRERNFGKFRQSRKWAAEFTHVGQANGTTISKWLL